MEQIVVFTDLDGTLVDHDTYAFTEAESTLEMLRQRSIPVIMCSSKTRAELEVYGLRMDLHSPFIVENGGAIFVPRHAFHEKWEGFVEKGAYLVMELGVDYSLLCDTWQRIKAQEQLRMTGFSEMTVEQIAAHSGLPVEDARLAAAREYSEPFLFHESPNRFQVLESRAEKAGLQITRGGRFYHLMGGNDKGRAVRIVHRLFAQIHPDQRVKTIGLGDSANDIPMLRHVDIPVVIRKKTGTWQPVEGVTSLIRSEKPGPEGWAETLRRLLD